MNQGIGAVPTSGYREVFPTRATTYEITVEGPGGEATARATVPPPAPPPPSRGEPGLRPGPSDAYFDYDKSDIRPDAEAVLRRNADGLKQFFGKFSNVRVIVAGHCDERGTSEYNLALGDRRATVARNFLVGLGLPADKLTTITCGEERPVCASKEESCRQRNRRAHFSLR